MDLLTQCHDLNEERKYEEVLDLLDEKIDDSTPVQLIAEYAIALIGIRRSSYMQKYRENWDAIKLIESDCLTAGYYPIQLQIHHGKALYEVDCAVRAATVFKKALAVEELQEFPNLYEYCEHMFKESCILATTKVRIVPFSKRVELAWSVFQDNVDQLNELMSGSDDIEDQTDDLDMAIGDILHLVFNSIEFELSISETGKYRITICLDEHKEYLFEYIFFEASMPDELRDTWEVKLGRPSRPNIVMHLGKCEISCDDLYVTMEPAEEKRANLFIYRDKNLLPNAGKSYINWLYNLMVCMCLGEPSRYRSVKTITAVDGNIPKFAFPLSQLPKELMSIGVHPSEDYSDYLTFSHTHTIRNEHGEMLLNSIHLLPGTSNLISQEPARVNEINKIFANLETDGATHITLGFSVKESGITSLGEIDNFLTEIMDAMSKYNASDTFCYTGFSISPAMGFIDFILWDGHAFIEALEKHMKDINFRDYRIYNINTICPDFNGFKISRLLE